MAYWISIVQKETIVVKILFLNHFAYNMQHQGKGKCYYSSWSNFHAADNVITSQRYNQIYTHTHTHLYACGANDREIAFMSCGLYIMLLTHWGRDKMDALPQTTFWSAFSWMKTFEFRLKFHLSLFPRVQLIIFQHWFRWWLGAV